MTGNVNLFGDAPAGDLPFDDVALRLHPADNIAVAKRPLQAGMTLVRDGLRLPVHQFIPDGHKIALEPVAAGEVVRRYGQIIGFASADIAPGDHVHVRVNRSSQRLQVFLGEALECPR